MSLTKDTRGLRLLKIVAFFALSAFCLALCACSVSTTAPVSANSNTLSVSVDNSLAVRILAKDGETVITNFALPLAAAPRGAFASDYFNVEVSSSNATGYRLYVSSDYQVPSTTEYSNSLVNIDDTSYTIPTLSSDGVSVADFSRPSGDHINKWGFSTDNTTYKSIPQHGTTKVVRRQDTQTTKELTTVYIGANVDSSMVSGTYRNILTFSALGNPQTTEYSLNFEPGTTDPVTNLPENMTASDSASQHTFTIPSTAPTSTGHTFSGYLDKSTDTEYQPGDTITIASGEDFTGSATLTAVWDSTPPVPTSCSGGANRICYISNEPSGTVSGTMEDQTIVYMTSSTARSDADTTALSSSTTELTLYSPNWTLTGYGFKGWNTQADGSGTMYGPNQTITLSTEQRNKLGTDGLPLYAQWVASAGNMAGWSGCSSLAQGSVTALTYDGDAYAIAKLADGKCWMIENLRYDNSAAGTKTTSFSGSDVTVRQYNVTNVDGTDGAYPINETSPAASDSTTNQYQWKSYGGYYTWGSKIGTTPISTNQYYNYNTATSTFTSTGTTQGICPTGWRIPRSFYGSATDNRQSDYRYLNYVLNASYSTVSTAAASNNWRKYPNNFVFSGYWGTTSSYGRGVYGTYWSSTASSSTAGNAYRVYIYNDSLTLDTGTAYWGRTARCVIGD